MNSDPLERTAKLHKQKVCIMLSLIALFTAIVYHSTFVWLYGRYMAVDSYYSHGFLIPLVTAILIWLRRDEIEKIQVKSSFFGLTFIFVALVIHLMSSLAEVYSASGFSLILLVFGGSLFLYGKKVTRKVLFPLFFLIFMIPLPTVAINSISFPMKMFATKSAVFILREAMSIPIRNEGFQVFFPNASLLIGNPCSGLRSLISMLALGSIFAYFLDASMVKEWGVFLISIPIALASNLIRVLMLCLGVYI